jgi:putative SbcD/Mre11-related phosphoesterase
MGVRFLTDYPAAFIPDKKALVIAELHLGIEYQLYKSGITIPPQGEKFKEIIEKLIEQTKSKILIIVGDIKHKVPGSTIREDKEIPKFLNSLKEKIKIILVRGNHDDQIEEIVPDDVKVYGSRGFKLGKYGFFHGHAWPSKKLMQCDYLFIAHIHPALEFKDNFGHRSVSYVWLKGKLNKELIKKKFELKKTGKLITIVLPTFNNILGGVAVNKITEEEVIGPLLKNKVFDLDNSKVYLLDGTYLGILKELRK